MQQDVSCSLVHTHTHTHSLSTGGNCLLVSTRRGYRQQLTSRSPHNLFWVLPWKQNMRLSCWYQNQQLPCLLCIELKWLLLLNPFHSARPPKGYSVSSFLPPQTFSPTSNMCTIHDIWSSHFMLINHMLQQQEEGRVAGCYYKPTRLPNERLEFESHHWIFLRTAGDVSICFLLGDKTRCYLRSGWGGGTFPVSLLAIPFSHRKWDHLHPWARQPKQVFWAKPCWLFSYPDRVVFVPKSNPQCRQERETEDSIPTNGNVET